MPRSKATRISLTYVLVALLWIGFSDPLVDSLAPNRAIESLLQACKSFLFIGVSGMALWLALARWERRWRESQDRLDLAMVNCNMCVWEWNVKEDRVIWSSEAEKLFGEGLPTCQAEFEKWVHHEDLKRVLQATQKAVESRSELDLEMRVPRPDGKVLWVLSRGRLRGNRFLGTLANVTAHKELEQQLRQAQKMEAVGQLAGGVAHDFNNLLMVVQGNTGLLQATADKQTAKVLAEILQAAQRAAELTQQLLVFGQRQQLKHSLVDLQALLPELAKGWNFPPTIKLELELGKVPKLKGDRGLLETVVTSLVMNARDAMPGGGTLRIRTSDVTLKDGLHAGRWVQLRVEDSGVGIEPELRERIFEPFFTTKELGKGTGLGLATVYAIVQQHKGFVILESTVGQGTSFVVHLPTGSSSTRRMKTPTTRPTAVTGDVILIVEDDPAVRKLLERILKVAGKTVLTADSGPSALQVWKEHKDSIRLLLTDMLMPGSMTGRQLALRLKAEREDLRVLYTSGYSREELRSVAPEELEDGFLPKPYLPDQLMKAVEKCLKSEV